MAKLREQIEQLEKLEKLGGDPLPPVPLQRGVGDFSKDLQTALNKVVRTTPAPTCAAVSPISTRR